MNDLLVIDIETVPGFPQFADLSPEFQSLWVAKISKTVPETTSVEESYTQRAAYLQSLVKLSVFQLLIFILMNIANNA